LSEKPVKLSQRERLKQPRTDPKIREPEERVGDFREAYLEFDRESAMREASRCVECKDPAPCQKACPLQNHIRDWLVMASEGRFLEAAAVSRSTSSMPEVCGRICPQDRLCENVCIVGAKNDPVAIGAVERFVNEYAFHEFGKIPAPRLSRSTGKRVAVVGSGPAGLACAEELRTRGHDITVFESLPRPGGLLVYGIPGFKLEKHVVERRVQYLRGLGIKFVCNVRIGRDLSVPDLFNRGFQAVFLGTGAQKAKNPKMPGMDLEGVHEALPFLIRNNLEETALPPGMKRDDLKGKKLAVFGGGDTAVDCLRTAARLGVDRVVCVYRRDEENMPGSRREVKRAKEEGVEFHFLTTPVRFIGDDDGHVRKVECLKMQLGEPDSSGRRSPIPIDGSEFEIDVDFAILAFGFDGDPLPNEETLKLTKWNTYEVDKNQMTSCRGVFAGGDGVRGADLLTTALKDGRDAAIGIDDYLRTLGVKVYTSPKIVLKIHEGKCSGCEICVHVCKKNCLSMDGMGNVEVVNLEACNKCMLCELLCPDFAVSVEPAAQPHSQEAVTAGS
jgi:glutamate synthase (NADPH/NADH) small chain